MEKDALKAGHMQILSTLPIEWWHIYLNKAVENIQSYFMSPAKF
jgi:hypothetical protein